jgi:outer membrane protein assembly factor BamA
LGAPGGAFQRGYPDARLQFPDDPVYARDGQPAYGHGAVSITAETRDHSGHATRGGVFRAAWSRYADRAGGAFTFDRYEADAAAFVPLARSRVVLALRGSTAASATAEGRTVPLYLLPSLGGGNTVRGFADHRFHDRNLVVVNAEARVSLFTHVDAAAFVDAGSVAARWSDLDLSKRSFGAGLRLHTGPSTLARLDVAHGGEGWRLLLRMTDALQLSRLSRRTAALPFAP